MIRGDRAGSAAGSIFDRWIAGALGLAALALSIHSLAEHDLYWQIATGRWIVEHGLPRVDPFSFAFPALPWIEPRWLFCLTVWLVQSQFGWNALILASAALILGTFFLLFWLPVPAWCRNLGGAVALAAACARFAVRPEIVTFALLVALLVALERFRVETRFRIFAIALPLQVLWVNSHTLFVLGPVVVALWLAGEELEARIGPGANRKESRLRRRALWGLLLALIAACFVNPYFARGALFPLQLFSEIRGEGGLATSISEFVSPFAHPEPGFFLFAYLVAGLATAASFFGRRPAGGARWPRALLFLAFAYLSALAQRNVALFALVCGVVLAANLGEAWSVGGTRAERWPRRARAVTLLFALTMTFAAASDVYYRDGFELRRFGLGIAPIRPPFGALRFAEANGIRGPLLHDIGDGGAILWSRGERSAFVDGRLEIYGEARLSGLLPLLEHGQGLAEATRRFGFRAALVEATGQPGLIRALESAPDWAPVYFDAGHVLYLHAVPGDEELLRNVRVDWRQPHPADAALPPGLPEWRPVFSRRDLAAREASNLGRLYVLVGSLDAARAAVERGAALAPRDPELRLYRYLLNRPLAPSVPVPAHLSRLLARPEIERLAATIAESSGAFALARDDFARLAGREGALSADFDGWVRNALAAGDLSGARAALLAQTGRFPRAREPWNNRGLLAYRAGDFADAEVAFSASLEIDPRQPSVLNQRALAALATGRTGEAVADWQRALALAPDYAPARQNLQRLEQEASAAGAPPLPAP